MKTTLRIALLCLILCIGACDWHDSPTRPNDRVPDIAGIYSGWAHYFGGDPGYQEYDVSIEFTLEQEWRNLSGSWTVLRRDGAQYKYEISGRILEGRIEITLEPPYASWDTYEIACYFDHGTDQNRDYISGNGAPPDIHPGSFCFYFWAWRE
jgi:hypothetical protein